MQLKRRFEIAEDSVNPESKFLVYAIVDPETLSTVYIGRSASGLRRPKQHFLPVHLKKIGPLPRWINKKLRQGLVPIITVIEVVESASELNGLEMKYIDEAINEGLVLKNLTLGGGGVSGHKRSDTTKAKLSNANKGRKPSQHCIEMIKKYRTGRIESAEFSLSLRQASKKSIPVFCTDNGKIYFSARHAQEDFPQIKCHKSILRSARTGKPTGGIIFRFV